MAVSRIDEAGLNVTQYGNRNLIINGAMQVAQRGTSQTSAGIGSIDRFQISASNFDELAFTMSQDSNAPDGFAKSLKVEITTAESALATDEQLSVRYRIEAQDLQMLDFNTANAKQTTLSFWVKSSDAATYSVFIYVADSGRMICENYTINAANTWEYKTITFSGDTGGAINDDNGEGFQFGFGLGAGSDYTGGSTGSWATYSASNEQVGNTSSIPTTTNATWQITGVQLEVGDTATGFEHRSYGDELQRCQRYFYQIYNENADYQPMTGYGTALSSTRCDFNITLPVAMRSNPTVTQANIRLSTAGGTTYNITSTNFATGYDNSGSTHFRANYDVASGLTSGDNYFIRALGTSGSYIRCDAEL
jgi:hypothetical protein